MTQKQLSVVVRAVDQLTGPFRGMTASVKGFGSGTLGVLASVRGLVGSIFTLQGAVLGIGAAIGVSGIIRAFGTVTRELDELDKAATRTGLSIRTLSGLAYAAKLGNVEFGAMADGVSTLNKNASEFARTGGGRAAAAFRELGVRIDNGAGGVRDMNELLPDLAAALAAIEDPARRAEVARRLFGDDRFLQFLAVGPERLRAITAEAVRLGVVYNEDQVRRAADYRDALTRLGVAWQGLKTAVLDANPAIARGINAVAGLISGFPTIAAGAVASLGVLGTHLYGAHREFSMALMESGKTAGMAFGAGLHDTITVLPQVIYAALRSLGSTLVSGVLAGVNVGLIAARVALNQIPEGLLGPVGRAFLAGIDALRDRVEVATRDLLVGFAADAGDFAASFGQAMGELRTGAVVEEGLGRIREHLARLRDHAAGMGESFAPLAQAIRNAVREFDALGDAAERNLGRAATWWGRFKSGVSDGWAEVARSAEDARAFGLRFTTDLATGFSQGLGNAIVGSIGRVKSFGNAMRDFASMFLRQVAQMIAQMLILRALVAIGSAFSSSGAGGLGGPSAFANYAARGAEVMPHGALKYAGGVASVPWHNPHTRRDVVPAYLMPGEGVVNTAGNARNPGIVAAMNRGAVVGGGGVHVTTSVTINVSGGGGADPAAIARAVERASADGVLKALSTRPEYRHAVRARLA